jgi:cysteinyl-tRNA synthetase
MDDDFDTVAALAFVFELVRKANTALDAGDAATVADLLATVRELCGAFGLDIEDGAVGGGSGDDTDIDVLVVARDEARARRDFAEADRIRGELTALGVTVEHGAGGTTWHR